MRWPWILLLIACLSSIAHSISIDWTSVPIPPQFTHALNDPIIYFTPEGSSARNTEENQEYLRERGLRCLAVGNPTPSYKWLKNGKPFNLGMYTERIVQVPDNGSFVFSSMKATDEGVYQCLASNGYGTAVSEEIRLEQTFIHYFPKEAPEEVKVELGDAYSRNCTPPESNPKARVYWIFKGDEGGWFESINSSHISTNEEGTIFFHYVKDTDFKPNLYYTCTALNVKLKDYKFGSQFRLDVTKLRRRTLTSVVPPSEQYVNQSAPIALNGNMHKLSCFFSGFPEPKPKWYHNGKQISEDNADGFMFESYGKTLVFNVSMSKAGKYDCKFPIHVDIDRKFIVHVESAPYWRAGPPANTNSSEGETVTFNCQTSGNPSPTVTFYKNGVAMLKPEPGAVAKSQGVKNHWFIDGSKLTIYDVKNGMHGTGDNAVYQCKAENKHGYLWTNFYLNLLAIKPQLLSYDEAVEVLEGSPLALQCKFFGYPAVKVTWRADPLFFYPHNVTPTDALGVGRLSIAEATVDLEGEYICIGENQYGRAEGRTNLTVRRLAPPEGLRVRGVGEDHINVTFVPEDFTKDLNRPVNNTHYVKFRPEDKEEEWQVTKPESDNLDVSVAGLEPETTYEVSVVSVYTIDGILRETPSRIHHISTTGKGTGVSPIWWIFLILSLITLLISILCCVWISSRKGGSNYPVSEKERKQGRELLASTGSGFSDVTDRRGSLTDQSQEESDADLMMEYNDSNAGAFADEGHGSFASVFRMRSVCVSML